MGKITEALKKAAQERLEQVEHVLKIKEHDEVVARKMMDSRVDSRLITYFDPKSVISEQYKILTTNLMALNKGKPPKTIAITSSIHSEGKTVTSLNLAISMAQATHKPKILLIDADMRRGRLSKYLGIASPVGLSEILLDQTTLNDALFKIDVENLTFLGAGSVPSNPAELLGSEKMRNLLNQLRPDFNFIVIDTPPVIPVTDPVLIGNIVDGVVLVVQSGRTQRGIVKRAAELLEQAHAKLLGHVLTGIEYYVPDYLYRYL